MPRTQEQNLRWTILELQQDRDFIYVTNGYGLDEANAKLDAAKAELEEHQLQELEAEGMTRSDAQGILMVRQIKLSERETQICGVHCDCETDTTD